MMNKPSPVRCEKQYCKRSVFLKPETVGRLRAGGSQILCKPHQVEEHQRRSPFYAVLQQVKEKAV